MAALVGRKRELQEVLSRLDDHRLVTLVGPGGIGKTALAHAVVASEARRFPLGNRVVDLTTVDDDEAVGGAIAAQLGFPSFTALLSSPPEQTALLMVDNCEHVLDAAAEAIDALLAACPSFTVVATSRSPLDLPGESLVALGPLGDEADAVQLFGDRARDAGTELPEDQRDAVVALCRALDGVPLALEIAAARTRVLTPGEILDRLDDLDTLSRPRFRGTERHRTLRSTIEWSYVQLDDADRARFDRLGILAAPFLVSTAQAVVGDADDLTTVDGLEVLVRSSLLAVDASGDATRYRLLHPLRTFALERLAERGEVDATWDRFVDHLLALAEALAQPERGRWAPSSLAGLVDLGPDLLAALRRAVAHDDTPSRSFSLLRSLWAVLHQGHLEDIAALGEAALARWPDAGDPLWADAVGTVATCRHLLGRPSEALALAEQALATNAAVSDIAACTLPRAVGRAQASLGNAAAAAAAFAETAAAAERVGLAAFAMDAHSLQAMALADLGRRDEAEALVERSRAQAVEAEDVTNVIWADIVAAHLALDDRPADAASAFADLVGAARTARYLSASLSALQGLAFAQLLTGDDAGARDTLLELLDQLTHGGPVSEPRSALRTVGVLLHRCGDGAWADLVATAEALPVISTFASFGPRLLPLPASDGRVLATSDAIRRARAGLEAERPASVVDARRVPSAEARLARFQREGDAWRVGWDGREVVVKASKGMADLARLLAAPGQELHCLELAGAGAEQSSTGEVIDDEARRAYEQRIRDLQAEIDEAEANHDRGRAEKAQVEFDAVVEHLASALGLGGRPRRGGSTAERARSAVTHRIRTTVRRLDEQLPALGAHLADSVTTGTYCSYRPVLHEVDWTL